MMSYDVLDVCTYVIEYSNEKDYGISNLKLQKILYFIQAYFLIGKNDHVPCFKDKIEAWDFGPVVPKAYEKYAEYGSSDIPIAKNEENEGEILGEDKKLIRKVIDKFSVYSATDLVSITQRQGPWLDVYEPYKTNEIMIDEIRKFFAD